MDVAHDILLDGDDSLTAVTSRDPDTASRIHLGPN